MKKQARLGKIFSSHISDKGLMFRIYEGLNPSKTGQKYELVTSAKKAYRSQISF